MRGRAQGAGGKRRLILAADDAQRAGADRGAVVVEGDRAGGTSDGRAAWADDAHRRGERHRLTVAPRECPTWRPSLLVFALLTTWVTAVEAGLGMKLASPLV